MCGRSMSARSRFIRRTKCRDHSPAHITTASTSSSGRKHDSESESGDAVADSERVDEQRAESRQEQLLQNPLAALAVGAVERRAGGLDESLDGGAAAAAG